jgi:hypothetical protein
VACGSCGGAMAAAAHTTPPLELACGRRFLRCRLARFRARAPHSSSPPLAPLFTSQFDTIMCSPSLCGRLVYRRQQAVAMSAERYSFSQGRPAAFFGGSAAACRCEERCRCLGDSLAACRRRRGVVAAQAVFTLKLPIFGVQRMPDAAINQSVAISRLRFALVACWHSQAVLSMMHAA